MGADIYLRSVNDRAKAFWSPKFDEAVVRRNRCVEHSAAYDLAQKDVHRAYEGMMGAGYFRDSYNVSSLFNMLGLSWWGACNKPDPLIGDDGMMGLEEMKRLRKLLDDHGQITAERLTGWAKKAKKERSAVITDEGEDDLISWAGMFEEKRQRLMALLDLAMKLGEPLFCSV